MKKLPIRFWRRLVQIGTLLAFAIIPLLNLYDIRDFVGNLVFFNAAGVPLADPLAVLQVALNTLSVTAAMLIAAGLVLLAAALLGPVFCAWLCPFGLLSELIQRKGGKKVQAAGAAAGTVGPIGVAALRDVPMEKTGRAVSFKPFLFKCAVAVIGLLLMLFVLPMPLLTQLSLPGWITRFLQHAILLKDALWPGLILVAAVLALEIVLGKRFWCRYLCPQSILISLAGLILPKRLQVRFTPKACTCKAGEQACRAACSLGLNPRKPNLAQKAQCTNCGDCVDACKNRGQALHFGFSAKDSK